MKNTEKLVGRQVLATVPVQQYCSCLNTVHAWLQPPGACSWLGHRDVMSAAQRGPVLHPAAPPPRRVPAGIPSARCSQRRGRYQRGPGRSPGRARTRRSWWAAGRIPCRRARRRSRLSGTARCCRYGRRSSPCAPTRARQRCRRARRRPTSLPDPAARRHPPVERPPTRCRSIGW